MARTRAQFVYIYALVEPDYTVRYVGMSFDPLNRFYNHHCMGQDGATAKWILTQKLQEKEPLLVILERVRREQKCEAEREWIGKLKPDLNKLKKGSDNVCF